MSTDIPDLCHTEAGRLASFQNAPGGPKRRGSTASARAPKLQKWPHSFIAPKKLAEAGFYYAPTPDDPDNVKCFMCKEGICGWTEDDDPFDEHQKLSPDCAWAIVAAIEAKDIALCQEHPLSERLLEARRATFAGRWPHEGKKGWKCKSKQLAEAGWIYKPTPEDDDFAACVYCGLGLAGWEPGDKPYDEHHHRVPDCAFYSLIEQAPQPPKKTAKGRKPRVSKASRLSTQSNHTIFSEAPSFADLTAEDGDSILTTATMTSQAGRKTAKGRKAAGEGRKTRTKKNEPSAITVAPEPEDDDFEVKVEPKKTRGKKRDSAAMADSSILVEAPAPKRRATRTRASAAVKKDVPVSKQMEDDHRPDISTTKGPKAAATRRGRNKQTSISSDTNNVTEPSDEHPLEEPSQPARPPSKSIPNHATLPNRKTRTSEAINSDRAMFAVDDMVLDDAAIDAELAAMVSEESKPLPKAKAVRGAKPRKPSARQVAAARRKAEAKEDAEASAGEPAQGEDESEAVLAGAGLPKPSRGRTGSRAISRQVPNPPNEPETKEGQPLPSTKEIGATSRFSADDSGDETDASKASQSTVVRGGGKKRASTLKKSNKGKKAISRQVEEFASSATTASKAPESPSTAMPDVQPTPEQILQVQVQEDCALEFEAEAENSPIPAIRPQPAKAKSRPFQENGVTVAHRAHGESPYGANFRATSPDPPAPVVTASTPQPTPRKLTPSLSPQSSDAENHPPSSKPSTAKPLPLNNHARTPLGATTPSMSPSKRNIIAGLQTEKPWTRIDLDEALLLGSPGGENAIFGAALEKAKLGKLASPEMRMTVEDWIAYNAREAEEMLRGECERMVGVFEQEGGRAMRVLEGMVCID